MATDREQGHVHSRVTRKPSPHRCVYCGRYTNKRVRFPGRTKQGIPACHNHDDLPALDPLYTVPDQWKEAR